MKPSLLFLLAATVAPAGCSGANHAPPAVQQAHSSTIAISSDGGRLFVVHPDADSVTVLDTATRAITHEVLLADAAPAVDGTGRFDPAVEPRALALDSAGASLFVTGERSGKVYAIDASAGTVTRSTSVCSEPIGVAVSADDARVFVACSEDDEVVELDARTLGVVATVTTPRRPWSLGWAPDGKTLLATHLLGPGVSELATSPLALEATWSVPDRGPETDPTEPHGQVRGIYDVLARPGASELWVAHLMLGTDTGEPALVFNNTVFPAVSLLDPSSGAQLARLSVQGANVTSPGDDGAFGDIVSGPRSMTFSSDGRYAFVVDSDSEDVLVVDAESRVEATIVRPLPGHLPEGAVFFDGELYVQERNSEDVAAFKVTEGGGAVQVTPDGSPIPSLSRDPMPATMRLGQQLFYSANSDEYPITQNHWVACASCHVEGRSDAVTWLFVEGPRDTPTNAGGTLGTGFLFHTGDRSRVQDYWQTIDVEQGGDFHPGGAQMGELDAIEAYVDYALPAPIPPSTDETHTITGTALTALRSRGEALFTEVGCATCHSGPLHTDSGMGNAALDLGGPVVSVMTEGGVLLHDVGTCETSGTWPDVVHTDVAGHPRPACAFDTPALRGLVDSAPYFHDGSAPTLEAVMPIMLRAAAAPGASPTTLSASDQTALIEYLRGL